MGATQRQSKARRKSSESSNAKRGNRKAINAFVDAMEFPAPQQDNRLWSTIEEMKEDIREVRSAQQDSRQAQQADQLHLHTRIDNVSSEMATTVADAAKSLTAQIDRVGNSIGGKFDAVATRVGVLEAFRWKLLGGNVVFGTLLTISIALIKYGSTIATYLGLK